MRRPLLALFPALLLGCGTDVSGPSGHALACLFSAPDRPAVGDVVQAQGGENEQICLTVDGAQGGFAYIPFFATAGDDDDDTTASLALAVVGGAFDPLASFDTRASSGPVLLRGGAAPDDAMRYPVRDGAFHDRLRQREIRELTPLLRGAAAGAGGPATRAASPERPGAAAPAPGDLLDFNVAISCSATELRTGRVGYVSERAIIVEDTANPRSIDAADLAYFGETFDTLVYPVETAHFGEPGDIDDNGRAIIFFTRAVNERNTGSGDFLTIGFFWSGDLFPEEDTPQLEACPAGNLAEMFYLIAPDPEGAAGPAVTVEELQRWAIPLIGHEFQHLINASRRMYVNDAHTFEDPWLNEGLSHAAEELLFFEAAGLEPRMNLDIHDLRAAPAGIEAFNVYMVGNFTNFDRYLSRPDAASLMGVDRLSTRGAAWAFLRYAADRTDRGDEAFFFDLVNSQTAGLDNLAEVLGADDRPLQWMQDWTVAVYADDLVPHIADRYQQKSWDLRTLYRESTIGFFPLDTHVLTLDDPLMVELSAGGAAYTEFGVHPDGRAMVHVEAEGRRPPPSLRGSVVRVR